MKILAIDDSLTMRRLIQKTLRDMGYYDTVVCESAYAATEVLKHERIDLILLDWHMPKVNGLEFLKQLKDTASTESIPVIMITVENEVQNVRQAIDCGAEGYILKPLNPEVLKMRLRDIGAGLTLGFRKQGQPANN